MVSRVGPATYKDWDIYELRTVTCADKPQICNTLMEDKVYAVDSSCLRLDPK